MKYQRTIEDSNKYHACQDGRMTSVCGKVLVNPQETLDKLPHSAAVCGNCLLRLSARWRAAK